MQFEWGGLCNNLLLLSHCIAESIEHNLKLTIITNNAFDGIQFDPQIKVVHVGNFLWRLIYKLNKIVIGIFHVKEKSTSEILNIIENGGNSIVKSYYFRDVDLFFKHSAAIRDKLSLKKEFINYADEVYNNIYARYNPNKIIAVHLRKGDYKTWRDGFFYYNDEEYLLRMLSLAEKVINLHFILISNEDINIEYFTKPLNGLASVSISSGSQYQDLAVLSKADYIMGPQSTYSAIASFLGDVPLHFFKRDCIELELDNFSWEYYFKNIFNGIKV